MDNNNIKVIPRNLRIVIAEAKELKANNTIAGTSDPFTVLKFRTSTYKTDVIKNTLAPIWNYIVDLTNVDDKDVIDLEVFDWERIGSNKSIGKIALTVADFKEFALSGQRDRWLQLTKKGFLRVTFDFTPPLMVVQKSATGDDLLVPTVPNNVTTGYDTMPPPVHLQPSYIAMVPMETTAEFSTLGEIYHERVYLTGSEVLSSVVYTVTSPVWVRALFVTFKGKITNRSKKVKTMVSDTRNLLHTFDASKKVKLDTGKHLFPFQFYIPKECKSSISAGEYVVEYTLTFYADTVNLPDICQTKKIKVVNIEDTNFKATALPISSSTSKTPLTGGSIELSIAAPKNCYYPGEDIEMDVKLVNKSKKTIKNIDFSLMKREEHNDTKGIPFKMATTTKQFLPKVYKGGSSCQTMVMELPDNLIPTTFSQKILRLEYELWVQLDIPSCVDLHLHIPINIVFKDPTIQLLPNPLTECSNIPNYIINWNDRHVYSWLAMKMNAPPAIVTEFDRFNIQGRDIMSFSDDLLERLCSGAGDKSAEIYGALRTEKYRCEGIRILLKSIQLPSLIPVFELECITTDTLAKLTEKDLKELGIKIGERKKIMTAIQDMNKATK